MNNHWQVIEAALKIARNHYETLEIYGYPEKVQAVDAAIAFVRETKTRIAELERKLARAEKEANYWFKLAKEG